jgi:hypothetical protein
LSSGNDRPFDSTIGFVRIVNSSATVSGSAYGAGIGCGYLDSGQSVIGEITIADSVVVASGSDYAPSVGAGKDRSQVDLLVFSGQNLVNSSSTEECPQVNASSILLSNASVVVVAHHMPVFNTDPVSEGWFDLVTFYREKAPTMVERLSLLADPFLHVQQFRIPGHRSGRMCIANEGYCRCFDGYSEGVSSAVISAPSAGNYTLPATLDGVSGLLKTPEKDADHHIPPNGTNISVLEFDPLPSTPTPVATAVPPETGSPEETPTPLATPSPDFTSPLPLSPTSAFAGLETLMPTFGHGLRASELYVATSPAIGSVITESSIIGLSSIFRSAYMGSGTPPLGRSESLCSSDGLAESVNLTGTSPLERKAPIPTLSPSSRLSLTEAEFFATAFEMRTDVSESARFGIDESQGVAEPSGALRPSRLVLSEIRGRPKPLGESDYVRASARAHETDYLSSTTRFTATSSFSSIPSPGTFETVPPFEGLDSSLGSSAIERSMIRNQRTVFSDSAVDITRLLGYSGVDGDYLGRNTIVPASILCATVNVGQTRVFSVSGVDRSSLFGNSGVNGDYLGRTNVFPSGSDVSELCGPSGANGDYLGRNTIVPASMLCATVNIGQTRVFSVSGIDRSSLFGNSGVNEGFRAPSVLFSRSAADNSRLHGSADILIVLSGVSRSSIFPEIDIHPSWSSLSVRLSAVESRSGVSGSVAHMDFPADAKRAQGANMSAALGAGLGVGLLVLVLVVSAVLFWLFARRRDATEVSETDELADDCPAVQDAWAELVQLASGENALASGGMMNDVPFMEAEIMEEGLWCGATVN